MAATTNFTRFFRHRLLDAKVVAIRNIASAPQNQRNYTSVHDIRLYMLYKTGKMQL
jgi:hypothetical protein